MVTLAVALPVVVVASTNSGGVEEGSGSDGRNSGASGGSDGVRHESGDMGEYQRHERHPSTENVEPTYDEDDDEHDDGLDDDDHDDERLAALQHKKVTSIITQQQMTHETDSDRSSNHELKQRSAVKLENDAAVNGKLDEDDDEEENDDEEDENENDAHSGDSSSHLIQQQQLQQQSALVDTSNVMNGLFGTEFNFSAGKTNHMNSTHLLAMQPPSTTTAQSTLAAFEALRQQMPNGGAAFLPQISTSTGSNSVSTAALFQQVAARALAQLSMQNSQQQQQMLGLSGANVLLPSPTMPNGMGGLSGSPNSFDANIAAAMAAFGFGGAIPPICSTASLFPPTLQQQNDAMSSLLLMSSTSPIGGDSKLKLLSQNAAADAHSSSQNIGGGNSASGRANVDSPTDQNNPDEESGGGSSGATPNLVQQISLSSGIKREESSGGLLQYSGESGAVGGGHDALSMSGSPMPNTWSFEEQFKSLYDIDTDPERKRFLDELFVYMQKKGSPINRIPIMAKQTLDLHKLYRLVVQRGGLVEVINKKQWREITKGLNLPSSITSAAFTLRTQYAKYLYPYECEKHNFSSIDELQSAIDGNKREGRRSDQVSTPSLPSNDTAGATTTLAGGDNNISSLQPRHHTPSQAPLLSLHPNVGTMAPSMAAPGTSMLNDALRAAAAAAAAASSANGARSAPSAYTTTAMSSATTTASSMQQHLAHLMNNNNGSSSVNMDVSGMNAVNQLLMMNSQQQQQQQLNSGQISFAEQMRKSSTNSSPESDETSQADTPATTTNNSSRKRAAPGQSTSSSKRASHFELLARQLVQQHDPQFNSSPASKRLCTDPYEALKAAAAFNQQQQLQAIQAVQAAAAAAAVSQSSGTSTGITTTAADSLLAAQQQQQHLLLSQQARNLLLPGLTSSAITNTNGISNGGGGTGGLSTCNMKITPRGDARNSLDSSLVVSMEINGILYQGVLFAHTPPLRL